MRIGTVRLWVAASAVLAMTAVACGGGSGENPSPSGSGSAAKQGGILRIGTINYIDSFNPYNYIEIAGLQRHDHALPPARPVRFVRQDGGSRSSATSPTTWDDLGRWQGLDVPSEARGEVVGRAADDRRATSPGRANTTAKYAERPDRSHGPCARALKSAEATDPTTVVIHYDVRSGTCWPSSSSSWSFPSTSGNRWPSRDGKGLKTYRPEHDLPIDGHGGAFTMKQYEKKGTTVFIPNPNY